MIELADSTIKHVKVQVGKVRGGASSRGKSPLITLISKHNNGCKTTMTLMIKAAENDENNGTTHIFMRLCFSPLNVSNLCNTLMVCDSLVRLHSRKPTLDDITAETRTYTTNSTSEEGKQPNGAPVTTSACHDLTAMDTDFTPVL